MSLNILGISAFYHDSAAALLRDGEIVAAAQEERFSRRKHDCSFPCGAVRYCLSEGQLSVRDLDYVVFYEKPLRKFSRLLTTYLAFAPRGFRSFEAAMTTWFGGKLFQKRCLGKALLSLESDFDWRTHILFVEHHLSHAASAFYASPFTEAVILTIDGVGEWTTTSAGVGRSNNVEIVKEIHFPHSLGLLYSAFTSYLGFKVNSGEYKLMGLAPYGRPLYVDSILNNLIDLKRDGSFHLNLDYFDYCVGTKMTTSKFDSLFGRPCRNPEDPIQQHHMDVAASIQSVVEEAVLRLVRGLIMETGVQNVCLAGGVALNCVANAKILREERVQGLWIQPASGDSGGAVGAAMAAHHLFAGNRRRLLGRGLDSMKGAFLGPGFSQGEIETRLKAIGAVFSVYEENSFLDACVRALCEGKVLGWFQDRMEFGPRALGARSILADARCPEMQSIINQQVKKRESFRPFAPAVLNEYARDWFDIESPSPYMLLVANVIHRRRIAAHEEECLPGIEKLKSIRSEIPAVTHVDYSARVQTVGPEYNKTFHKLLTLFHERTGCPVLLNTSFNVRGEPIVCTPEDAFLCFMNTDIEVLGIGNCLLRKRDQEWQPSWQTEFGPD